MTAGRNTSRPVAIERPVAEAELVAIVKQAAAAGHRMRAVGRFRPPASRPAEGEGCSRSSSTDGIAIDLAHYGRLLRVDRNHGWAKVQAGISVGALHHGLAARGLSMANGPGDVSQSIGAAISSGAHGTGARFAGLAAEVVSLELVTAAGELVECSASADEAPNVFAAARVGLGALGVISTVTVRCQAGFNLRRQAGFARLEDVLASFDQLVDSNDHFEFSWFSGTRWARTFRANRTDEPRGASRSYRTFPGRRLGPAMVEYALPRWEAVAAIEALKGRIGVSGHTAPFPIRVRVAAGDDIPLSPATGRPTAYIAVPAGALSRLLDDLGGRPEWAGPHGCAAASLRDRYPRWEEWHALRRRLDPELRFANAFTEAVLGA